MVVALAKGLGLTIHDVLYEYSYTNLVMLASTIPPVGIDKSKSKDTRSKGEIEWDDAFDANNPDLADRFE